MSCFDKVDNHYIIKQLKKDAIFIKGHADQIYNHEKLKNIKYGIYKKV